MVQTLDKLDLANLLFQDLKGLIEVREIDQEKAKSRFFKGLEHFKTYTPPIDKNVYVGMFSRLKAKGIKANCYQTNVLWADYDYMTLEQAKENILKAGLPSPSLFVGSGNGIHSYWLLDKPVKEGIEEVLKAIANSTEADTKAAEIARVMRLPGTYNVKGDIPKLCRVLEQNDNRYSFEMFQNIFGTVTKEESKAEVIDELQASKMACIRLIAKGVGKRQRNFALGKITAFMKQQGFSRKKAFEIANRWNKNNNPVKPDYELKDQFNRFWDSDYKYLGCHFTNPDLERINKQLCPIGECQFHAIQKAQVIDSEVSVPVDNEIFKNTVYPKMKALEIACYSWITREKELSKEQLSKYVNRHIRNDNFIQALKGLKAKGLIEIKKGIPKNGEVDKVILKSKSNYGRGYTLIPNLLTKLFTKKGISDNAYKLMVLLKHYSFGKEEVYPTVETMASKLGISERWVTELLKWLEDDEGLIKRSYKQLDNGKTKLIIKLLY
jgi:hypothetical protein